jgi:hypothetical protein
MAEILLKNASNTINPNPHTDTLLNKNIFTSYQAEAYYFAKLYNTLILRRYYHLMLCKYRIVFHIILP